MASSSSVTGGYRILNYSVLDLLLLSLSVGGGFPSFYLLSHLPFCVASETIPTTAAPPTPLLKATQEEGISVNRRILIAVVIASLSLVLVLLMVMASLKFLGFRFRFRIRRKPKRVVDDAERGDELSTASSHQDSKGEEISSVPKRFSWDEVERFTVNFSRVIGEGGFSTVYLAHFPNSTLGAIKVHNNSERLNRVFKQELEILLHIQHPHIIDLLGYCDEREGVLVFEYVPNGSLQEKLHGHGESLLPWKTRMSIAYQLAQAIAYLHDNCTLQIVHGDIKASNILLDQHFNCKLCDFGFAKMGFSSAVLPSAMNPVMGSPGYIDPHYLRTGIASKKNDVYSFGVIVLELITGIEAFCSEKEQLLTSIAGPLLGDLNKVPEMVDSRLEGQFETGEAMAMASISALCLRQQPSLRPSMAEILCTIRERISCLSFVAPAEGANDTTA
uniref:non-specific serine/threonine protein kinase n=1 Tax=Nelumbo nucifera TaxID=4432 RepID=A0A822YU44_NELNU|nr:TPA_asm: hypothetical protein HUJ06_006697 [Nelumbo nucifera]